MDLRLNPHLPIITPRIEFSSLSQSHPPTTITPRIDFTELWKMETPTDSGSHAVSPSDGDSDDEEPTAMDLDEVNNCCDIKIPKPPGEPGQPN